MNIKRIMILGLCITMEILCMNNKTEIWFSTDPSVEIYPMPVFGTLTVADVQKSAEWYEKTLGFKTIFSVSDSDTHEKLFVHLRREKYQDLLLKKGVSDKATNSHGIALTFQAWGDIDVLTDRAKQQGATIVAGPEDTSFAGPDGNTWGTRDVTFQDIDGYRVIFTAPKNRIT
jgi:predicted lactoylglutathione lyase